MTLSMEENTVKAVTSDIGGEHDIHPSNKKHVGLRLVYVGLHRDYGGNDIVIPDPPIGQLK